ncbi:hypothetical protein [Vibrio anguillarum]|uniref:hypothetical protein n=1 Tax=Vibrio anguillarum TaxID=55601 RepID=UPI000BB48596|nr:hypothetical protein [Vibrio anguillarum]ATC60282.1 hypothetical protein CMV05_23110 [Vibrio anguillarum]MBF4249503.1 hypothetical protein [Vibrio anguillarum]MBF4340723.1 hypothetical protein [Vibrio anguillarum]
MSVWMELRCEESIEEHAERLYTGKIDRGIKETSECWSHINSGCGETSDGASQKSVIETYKDIFRTATESGWKRVNGNWVCPHCLMYKGKNKPKAIPWA